jgi:LPXTG-motif cell wall-anchored protein
MTKTLDKAISLIAALVMALVMTAPVGSAYAAGTGSITITPPAGTAAGTTNTYNIYKVFDASGNGANISYTLPSGKQLSTEMTNAGFSVDAGGNVVYDGATLDNGTLSSDAIAAIADFVKDDTAVATATSTGTTNAVAENLPNGYYYITTSTGTAVTIDSTNPNATVFDKNAVPSVSKKITSVAAGSVDKDGQNAIAQAGSTVSYEADITLPTSTINASAKAKGLTFSDAVVDTQTLAADSVAIKVNNKAVDAANYTLSTTDNAISIAFKDSYIASLTTPATIAITYNTTVNSDALFSTSSDNTASITYGDNKATVSSNTTHVYNAKVIVNKTFNGLEGALNNNNSAEFVLQNADGKYYAINDAKAVSWVDSIDKATKLSFTATDTTGDKAFTGLADGKYTVIESKTPAGYKTAANTTYTINNGTVENAFTASNLVQTANVENKTGTALPSTGDMGTTILYILGAALVISAGVLLINKRKAQK